MAEATWSTERSAERRAEIEQWLVQAEELMNGVRETDNALNKMLVWHSRELANAGQGGVEKLSGMSFEKVLPGIVRQFSAIKVLAAGLRRQQELEQWRREEGSEISQRRGRTWYETSFDPRDARVVDACVGIQEGLLALQLYVTLWRNVSGGAEPWGLYNGAMEILESLVIMGGPAAQTATQTPAIQTSGVAATTLAEMRSMLAF